MLIGFMIGGFVFFTLVSYFVVLFFFPEWVGVSGRDHQKSLEEHRGDSPENKLNESQESSPKDK
jgi:hypothetical protein